MLSLSGIRVIRDLSLQLSGHFYEQVDGAAMGCYYSGSLKAPFYLSNAV